MAKRALMRLIAPSKSVWEGANARVQRPGTRLQTRTASSDQQERGTVRWNASLGPDEFFEAFYYLFDFGR